MGQAPKGVSYNTVGTGYPLLAGAGDFGEISPVPVKWTDAPTKLSAPNDIILCIRATIGDRNWSDKRYCLGRGVAGLRANNDELNQRYLWYWLDFSSSELKSKGRGATFLQVSKADIALLQIPLPPLPEQKRIAAILDAADALRVKRREALAQLDALIQSTFLDMFGDPVTNPKGWESSRKLGETADIVSGITKGRKVNGNNLRDVPYLAVVNVQDRHLNLDKVKTIPATDSEIEKYTLKAGDLLLTEGGDPDKLGRGTLWNNELMECIHQNHIFRVRLKTHEVEPVFLNWIVGSTRGKKYFCQSAKQTTGIASINMTQLKAFPMLIPPLPLQHRFASIVESVEKQKNRMRAHLAELDTLFAALQSRAFNGELL